MRKEFAVIIRTSVAALCAVSLAFSMLGCGRPPAKSAELERLAGEYMEALPGFYPTWASSLGWHEYDGQLGSRNPEAIEAWVTQVKELLGRAEGLEGTLEDPDDRFDRDILEWLLRRELLSVEVLRRFERDPLTYSFDLSRLLLRTVPSWPERAYAIVSRLEQLPTYLSEARTNLENPPRPVTETGIRTFRNLAPFLRDDLPQAMQDLDPDLSARLDRALPEAVHAAEEMARWLEQEVLPDTKDDFALGEETYLEMLLVQEQFDYSIEQLTAMGREELSRLQAQFQETAALIDPDKSPQEVARLIASEHPRREDLVGFAQSELEELKRRVIANDLVTIPEGGGAIVEAAPAFRRWNPAYIMPPGPFDPDSLQAIYFISPGEVDLTPDQVEAWLRGMNNYTVRNTSVHEVYPGHYVNSLHIRHAATPIRKLSWSYAFGEGWAHYSEELFMDHAYEEPVPAHRLAQIQDALLRACRYMTSIGLHTQGWSVEDGTQFFMENAYVEEVLARQQSVRGTFDPGYLLYTLGKLYIKQMREDYRKKVGDQFTLKAFHDALLQYGSPPLPMVRARLLGD
ncbi:MAG: DUF885 domain-containing protein [Acidobacteria bacterium]|nr:DUF885 domain-containing protein [Acidobacteriota bacterium]